MKKSLRVILWAVLVFAACTQKEEPAAIEPVVRTVLVESSELEILPGGSAILPFTVEDKEASFLGVKLLLDGGKEPEEFFLQEVTRGTERGSYQAVIQDAGLGKNYERDVHLAILQRSPSTGNEYYVPSSTFRVYSEANPPGTVYTGLPVVYVDTEGGQGIYSKEDYVKASLKIQGTEQYDGLDAVACDIWMPWPATSAAGAIRPGTGPRSRIFSNWPKNSPSSECPSTSAGSSWPISWTGPSCGTSCP